MTLLLAALMLLLLGAFAALLAGSSRWASRIAVAVAVAAGALTLGAALPVLLGGGESLWRAPWPVPGGALVLRLDALAAVFLLPLALLGGCCALFGAGYLREEGRHRSLAPHWFYFNLLLTALLLVVTAANAVLFLAAWEVMTLSSFLLVAWDHRRLEVRQAAWLYLLAAHGGLMLLLAFFVQAGVRCGSFDFAAFTSLAALPTAAATGFFLLALFGFGVKAGLFPLHVWLPDAHPAAPSHVSALMSGMLVKSGIYGLLRVLSWLPPAPAWWGWLIAVLGGAGALYGIVQAAQQRDIKRCLAYSTVENVGIILLGIGFGLVALAQGHPAIALLALAGALLHIWNHALFKGLMFLGAGALVHAVGSRDLNAMGGLLRRMPLTGLCWIGGSLAIAALPPLNGLVSEWLIYLGLAQAGQLETGFAAMAPLLLFGLLGLVGTLALVTFSRLIGIALLGEPRTAAAAGAHEAGPALLWPPGLLLAACLTIGMFPTATLSLLAAPLAAVIRQPVDSRILTAATPLGQGGLLLALSLAVLVGVLLGLRNRRPLATAATWGCGFRFPTPRMAYTAGGYAELVFRHLLPKRLGPELRGGQVEGLFPTAAGVTQQSRDPVLRDLLQPLFLAVADRCQRLRWLQQGQLPIYLCYIFILSTVLMAWVLWLDGKGG